MRTVVVVVVVVATTATLGPPREAEERVRRSHRQARVCSGRNPQGVQRGNVLATAVKSASAYQAGGSSLFVGSLVTPLSHATSVVSFFLFGGLLRWGIRFKGASEKDNIIALLSPYHSLSEVLYGIVSSIGVTIIYQVYSSVGVTRA